MDNLSRGPFFYAHAPKNLLLILLGVLWLPCSLALTTVSLLFGPTKTIRQTQHAKNGGCHRKTILVTGVSMTKGLTIARLLAQHTPHCIIGADTEPIRFTSPGRYSRAIARFYRIHTPEKDKKSLYIKSLLRILETEKVDLWISCSSVVGALEDGEVMRTAQTLLGDTLQAVQFNKEVVAKLHEKDALVDYLRNLGLAVPESHRCTSAEQVEELLREQAKDGARKFILKPIGVDDKARAQMMTLLPLSDISRTQTYLSSLRITPERPFILQQFIDGPEYCTHSLVVRGQVKAFVSCPSSDMLMHYQALPPDSSLNLQMLEFTKRICDHEGADFTGHLSLDFLVEGHGETAALYPIECNPRAHTAVVLFQNTPAMANAYLSCVDPMEGGDNGSIVTLQQPTECYYWIGHDLVTLLITPLFVLLCGHGSVHEARKDLTTFWRHLTHSQEGTFLAWDPWPFFVLYHIYWPIRFFESLIKGPPWSRINVSTTKMFEC